MIHRSIPKDLSKVKRFLDEKGVINSLDSNSLGVTSLGDCIHDLRCHYGYHIASNFATKNNKVIKIYIKS